MPKLAYLMFAVIMVTAPVSGIAGADDAPQARQDPKTQADDQTLLNQDAGSPATSSAAEDQQESPDFVQKMRDATITASIKTKMLFDGDVDALKINVDTVNQVVTLSGTVDSPEQIVLAQELAERTAGVISVYNQIQVNTMSNAS